MTEKIATAASVWKIVKVITTCDMKRLLLPDLTAFADTAIA
jgi:hypothetical protein